MTIETDINPLIRKELGKMTVNVKVIGVKKAMFRLWLAKALLKLGARIAGMGFRYKHSVEIEVS